MSSVFKHGPGIIYQFFTTKAILGDDKDHVPLHVMNLICVGMITADARAELDFVVGTEWIVAAWTCVVAVTWKHFAAP